ncbi:MAG TPA: glycosyltransferase family 2 protein [Phenylobacterium sp.]|nr:glycosyltransferase family 2 protein [Phenylobacterium sp.]
MKSSASPPPLQPLALSIVAPCYNEERGLAGFVERMVAAAVQVGPFELILVNDGSRDRTWACVQAMAARYPQVVGADLARNHGHQLAVTAGLSLARGGRVLVIDADQQDPPELLGPMMVRMDEGFDVVYGRRRSRPGESRFKRTTATMFYRLLGRLSEVDIPTDTGDFRLMSRRIVDRLNAMPEQDRFLRGMVAWLGGAQSELLYDRETRTSGQTGYTLARMLRLATDGLAGFSRAPLKLAVVLACVGIGIAVLVVIWALIAFATGRVLPGWTSLALIMLFFGVAQLGCLAIIGAYLGRIYMQLKGRPLFLINEIVGGVPPHGP